MDKHELLIYFVLCLGMIYNEADREKRKEGFKKYSFNVLISDRIGPHRNIPDTRFPLCKNLTYSPLTYLPKSSIIICFYNEAFSVLERNVVSILERTQSELIHEIILVDDYSDEGKLSYGHTSINLINFSFDRFFFSRHKFKTKKALH